eukprot:CAMPEP_0180581314 /NCGR_PEP_ID=MMETSP1037_2-20121125/13986_1 /TAXON_ID=632150 /ORGANISM="Azadinium spinosum, Strain 3D9" /LENGTH=113 /DNA_ID=CAMNT_0022599289 /DNA_START=47 /DNA_END=383 /DNA_ORIENTATION=-
MNSWRVTDWRIKGQAAHHFELQQVVADINCMHFVQACLAPSQSVLHHVQPQRRGATLGGETACLLAWHSRRKASVCISFIRELARATAKETSFKERPPPAPTCASDCKSTKSS